MSLELEPLNDKAKEVIPGLGFFGYIDLRTTMLAIGVFILASLLLIAQFPVFTMYSKYGACPPCHTSKVALESQHLGPRNDSLSLQSDSLNRSGVLDTHMNTSREIHVPASSGIGEKVKFLPVGSGAYLFIEMSAYRGGTRYFSVIGLGSKPVHVFSNASFQCEWISGDNYTVAGKAEKMLPDWGYGRVYTVVVVSCTFSTDVGTDSKGGELILYASPGISFEKAERLSVLKENPGEYNESIFNPPYPYDYVYCGSPLYGSISPQRIREWIAYHAKFFGPRSHFFFYDAGGIHPGVQTILEPWIKSGWVTVENVREQEEFDGYYHNQFLIVNDCLHRTRFLTNWTFFFDVDEYLYTPEGSSVHSVLTEFSRFTEIFIDQKLMSNQLCLIDQTNDPSTLWGFEKLVFNSVQKGVRRDRKYAIQPRNVYATGVHLTQNFKGKTAIVPSKKLRYYHYHETLNQRGELCRKYVGLPNSTDVIQFKKEPFKVDKSMQLLGSSAKSYELQQIGPQPFLL